MYEWTLLFNVDVTPDDVLLLSCLSKNPILLSSIFSHNCLVMAMTIQSPLETDQLAHLLQFLSFVPSLKSLYIHSNRSEGK